MTIFKTSIKGSMTPIQFLQEGVDDLSTDEIKRVILQNGFMINSQVISNPEVLIDFKTGDIVIFKLYDLQFDVV